MSEAEALIEVPAATAAFPKIEPPPFDPDPVVQPRGAVPAAPTTKQATTAALAAIELLPVALARFGDWRPQAAALVQKYTGVVFDCATTKGMAEATAARAEVRGPRYAAQNVSKASKSELAKVSKAIGAEEQAIIDALAATEKAIDDQIKSQEEKAACEKADREQKERVRIAMHEANINAIRSYSEKAVGLNSAQINSGLARLTSMTFGPEWQEYAGKAEAAREVTVSLLLVMRDKAKAQEEEAARREAQRVEQERVAAEQKAEAERLAAVAAELKRQEEVLRAERERQDALNAGQAELAAKQEAYRLAALVPAVEEPATIPAPEQVHVAIDPPAAVAMAEAIAPAQAAIVAAAEAAPSPAATLHAGQIGARLGFTLTISFIERTLGIQGGIDPKRKNVVWTEAQWGDIKSALVGHIQGLPQ